MKFISRRDVVVCAVTVPLAFGNTACVVLLRLLVRGGLAARIVRFGRYRAGARAYGISAAAGTIARPAAFAHLPTVSRSLAIGRHIEVVGQRAGHSVEIIGRVVKQNQSIDIQGANGQLYLRSTLNRPQSVKHFDNRGTYLGESRFSRSWDEITHYGPDGRSVGSDTVRGNTALHFDQRGRSLGQSTLTNQSDFTAYEWVASVGLIGLMDFYAASLEYCDEKVMKLYDDFRRLQEHCLESKTLLDCDKVNALYGALFDHLSSGRTC